MLETSRWLNGCWNLLLSSFGHGRASVGLKVPLTEDSQTEKVMGVTTAVGCTAHASAGLLGGDGRSGPSGPRRPKYPSLINVMPLAMNPGARVLRWQTHQRVHDSASDAAKSAGRDKGKPFQGSPAAASGATAALFRHHVGRLPSTRSAACTNSKQTRVATQGLPCCARRSGWMERPRSWPESLGLCLRAAWRYLL